MAGTDYTPVKIPTPLLELVDLVIETHPMSFRTRSEFIMTAIRDYLTRSDEHAKRMEDLLHTVTSGKTLAKLREHIDDD